jgi:tRNA pseudouridine38-40 synthase
MGARLTIEYEGTRFAGWGRQPGARTVQGELERAVGVLLRRPRGVPVTVAGRTDAGVHALAQVASYQAQAVPVPALNALLPDDVAVLACEPAPPWFDARRDATSRAYCYRVLARRARGALARGRALHVPVALDRDALHACAAALPGTHDFTAFTPTQTGHVRFERDVFRSFWREDGEELRFWIEADAFMRHMNRVLVGTMLEVARGRRSVADFAALLGGRARTEAGPTAPPHGLYLAGIGYDGHRVLAHTDDTSGRTPLGGQRQQPQSTSRAQLPKRPLDPEGGNLGSVR